MSTELTDIENFYSANPADFKDISLEMLSSPNQVFHNGDREIDGIEILYNMAKTGKIDPWNIDLVDLADKYFLEFAKLKQVNLKHTARTILFLSVLLRIKSNILEGIDIDNIFPPEPEENYDDDYEPDYEDEEPINRNNVISIDEVLQRRTSVRLNRNRVVTLKDLVRQLEFYEKLDKQQELKSKLERQKRRMRSYARFSSRDIVDMYGDDQIKNAIPKMKENLDRIFEKETKVELETLTLLGFSRTTAYLALLFLVTDTDYDINQDKMYSELYVEKYKAPVNKEVEEQTV